MYDFDKTLSTKDMQEYSFIPHLGITSNQFWIETDKLCTDYKMDKILAYMFMMINKTVNNNKVIKRDYLTSLGKDIDLFKGVESWFERINEYGKSLGVQVEHYIISSGLKEIIEGTTISKYFKQIYASEFFYNEDGNAIWPKTSVNYTAKTQFLSRINKGVLDISDDINLNKKMLENERRIRTTNMIYIGDGLTDIPCMRMNRQSGGTSIAVYTEKSKNIVKNLLLEDRVDYIAHADYSKESEMDIIIKQVIEKMAIDIKLKSLHEEQTNKMSK